MLRFVHAADLHIDSPLRGLEDYPGAPVERVRNATRAALENLVRVCLDEKAAFLIVAGDLFDQDWKDFNTALFVVKQFQVLERAGIPVYLIHGNHDSVAGMSRNVPWPKNVTRFGHQVPETVEVAGQEIALHGMSFPSREVGDNLVPSYPVPRKDKLNIGILHTNANGDLAHGSYAPCTVAELADKGYEYWALGHVHSFAVLHREPHVVYSGNTQGRHIRETGAKGCVVVTVDGDRVVSVEPRTTDVLRWHSVALPLDPADHLDDLYQRFADKVRAIRAGMEERMAAIRLEVVGRCAAHRALTSLSSRQEAVTHLRSLAGADGEHVWLEKVHFRTQANLDRDQLKKGSDLVGELLRSIDQLAGDDEALRSLVPTLKSLGDRAQAELDAEGVDLGNPATLRGWLAQAEAILLDHVVEVAP